MKRLIFFAVSTLLVVGCSSTRLSMSKLERDARELYNGVPLVLPWTGVRPYEVLQITYDTPVIVIARSPTDTGFTVYAGRYLRSTPTSRSVSEEHSQTASHTVESITPLTLRPKTPRERAILESTSIHTQDATGALHHHALMDLEAVITPKHLRVTPPPPRRLGIDAWATGFLGRAVGLDRNLDKAAVVAYGAAVQYYVLPILSVGVEYVFSTLQVGMDPYTTTEYDITWWWIIPEVRKRTVYHPGWEESTSSTLVTPSVSIRTSSMNDFAWEFTGGYTFRSMATESVTLGNAPHFTAAARIQSANGFRLRLVGGVMNGAMGVAIHTGFGF